jgi:Holliday junction resolvasome RuvABC DNA-binding subunit
MQKRSPIVDTANDTIEEDITSALVNLGCRKAEARDAVTRARPHVGNQPSHEALLRAALRQLRKPESV